MRMVLWREGWSHWTFSDNQTPVKRDDSSVTNPLKSGTPKPQPLSRDLVVHLGVTMRTQCIASSAWTWSEWGWLHNREMEVQQSLPLPGDAGKEGGGGGAVFLWQPTLFHCMWCLIMADLSSSSSWVLLFPQGRSCHPWVEPRAGSCTRQQGLEMLLFPVSCWADSVPESWASEDGSGRRAVATTLWIFWVGEQYSRLLPHCLSLSQSPAISWCLHGLMRLLEGKMNFLSNDAFSWLHEQRGPLPLRSHLAGLSSINPELLSFPCGCLACALEPAEVIFDTSSLILCCRCLCIVLVWLWWSVGSSQEQSLGSPSQLLLGVHFSQQRFANLHLQII